MSGLETRCRRFLRLLFGDTTPAGVPLVFAPRCRPCGRIVFERGGAEPPVDVVGTGVVADVEVEVGVVGAVVVVVLTVEVVVLAVVLVVVLVDVVSVGGGVSARAAAATPIAKSNAAASAARSLWGGTIGLWSRISHLLVPVVGRPGRRAKRALYSASRRGVEQSGSSPGS